LAIEIVEYGDLECINIKGIDLQNDSIQGGFSNTN